MRKSQQKKQANKRAVSSDTEQIAFKLTGKEADLKRRFLEMLQRRGSTMRERIIAYMYVDVRHDGKVMMLPFKEPAEDSTAFAQDANRYLADLREVPIASPEERCHNHLRVVLELAPEHIRDIVIRTIETFAEVALEKHNSSDGRGQDVGQIGRRPDASGTQTTRGVDPRVGRPGAQQQKGSQDGEGNIRLAR